MSTHNPGPDVPVRHLDRILAFTALVLAALSIIMFFVIMIASATGMAKEDFATGPWPFFAAIPLWGLPIAFVLIIVLLASTFIRKGRAAKRS